MIAVYLENPNTNDLYEIPYQTIRIDEELNAGESCRVNLEYRSIEKIASYYGVDVAFLLTGGRRRIKIQKNGTNIFLGIVSDFNLSKDNKDGLKLDIAGASLFNALQTRFTDNSRIFTSTDAGQIAWTLINETQTNDPPYSDLGIAQGLIQTSVNRSITYRFAEIRSEITNLSNKKTNNGFDFEIDDNGMFNVYYPTKGVNRPDIFFDESNIIAWGARKPLILSLANRVYIVGSGYNDNVIWSVRNSPNTYKTNFGLLEEVISSRTTTDVNLLNDIGDKFLLDNQSPVIGLTITHNDDQPSILDYSVGDSMRCIIPEMGIASQYKRVYKRTVSIDINAITVVSIELR